MNVLVTGANGFIGKNLTHHLTETGHQVTSFLRSSAPSSLTYLIGKADAIIHLAGENRPENVDDYEKVNFDLTVDLCNAIRSTGKKIPLVFASSTQANAETPYGSTKLAAERALKDTQKELDIKLGIYRLPNVFGKWCKPNYNSVVATFCHNIANDLPIKIRNKSALVELAYIDDVVQSFLKFISTPKRPSAECTDVKPTYMITLGELAETLLKFKSSRDVATIQRVGSGLTRALYSTYVSYIAASKFNTLLQKHSDQRGDFVEMLKTTDSGQISYFTALPGMSRGGHYHHTKTEKFLVIRGTALFKFRNILTGDLFELIVHGGEPQIVDTVPGWAHGVTNIGKDELIIMLWANEVFDPTCPDTYLSHLD